MELIKIYQGNLVNARELYEKLNRSERFSRWFERLVSYGFKDGENYTPYQMVHPQNKQVIENYLMTLNMAKQACMLDKSEAGQKIREYFIQCEEALKELVKNKRLEVFLKLEATKERLLENVESLGGTHNDFIQIDFEGRKVLFNGEPLPDEQLSLVLLKGRDFASELTNEFFKQENINLHDIENTNKENHSEVRKTVIKRTNKKPEDFQLEDDVRKILKANQSQVSKDTNKPSE